MRVIGVVLLTAAVLVSTAGSSSSHTPARETCRQQWTATTQLHGENGNPGGSGATRQLQHRWDRYHDHASRLGRKAKPSSCARIGAFALAWDGLERLMYGLHPHDYLYRLRLANAELSQYREVHDRNPGRRVMRAFRFLREQAPRAAGDLAPVVDAATAITTSSRAQVTGYLRDYRAAARASRHAMKAKRWLQIIQRAELSER